MFLVYIDLHEIENTRYYKKTKIKEKFLKNLKIFFPCEYK